jgi:hypothetical protein
MSVYSYNERVLGAMWLLWGVWLLRPALASHVWRASYVLALIAIMLGTVLLVVHLPVVKPRLDALRWGRWPASVLLRMMVHVPLTAFALLIAMTVAISDLTQVRIVVYVALAFLHAGKLLRLHNYQADK